MKKGDLVNITKIVDNFDGNHPNGINEGFSKTGTLYSDLVVGENIVVISSSRQLTTSKIIEIVDENTVKTRNSTYRIELVVPEDL